MSKSPRRSKKPKGGRPKVKGEAIPFKFRPDLEEFLRGEAARTGKPMVLILEEQLEYRRSLKRSEIDRISAVAGELRLRRVAA